MKCESLALAKYIDKSPKIFFIYGEEIVLQNHARDSINKFFYEKGFTEKKIIVKKDFPNIQKILVENAGGSLFGTKIIIEIIHEGGKIPNDLLNIFSLRESDNYVILIRSAIKKISNNSSWVKQVDKSALIIECKKLKSFEEKIWLKNNLEFISEKQVKKYVQRISDLFPGNLVAQQNEINLLRLMYEEKNEISTRLIYDGGEFSPYELEINY